MFNKLKLSIVGGTLLASFLYSPLGHAQSLTVQGKVLDASGAPLMNGLTEFRVQILTPDGNKCVLFDESHSVDLAASKGLFSVNLGDGTGTVNPGSTYGLEDAISNVMPLTVLPSKCASGAGTYSPGVSDNRKVVIQFTDATMGGVYQVIPEMDLNPVAYAMESRTLNGFPAASVLRVVAGGVPGVAPILSIADATELASLATGSSTKYMARASNGSAQVPAVTSTPTGLAAGSMWFDDSVGGKVLKYYDGTTIQTVGGGGGGAPTGAAGGDLTGSYPNPTLDKIKTVPLTITSLTTGQFLKYNGTAWINAILSAADLPTIGLTKGGTGLTAAGAADQILGMNSAGTAMEYKTLTAGSNVTITPAAGTFTISAAANLAPIASQTLLANPTGSSAVPAATTLSQLLDTSISANQGSLLFRNSVGWTVLPPGTNGYVLKTQGAMADPIWGASSGGGGTVTSVDVAAPNMVSSGAITGAGTVTLSYSNQTAGTVLAAPTSSTGAPSFRALGKTDLRSTMLGAELFDVAGSCAAGQNLSFDSAAAKFTCLPYSLTAAQITAAQTYVPVNKAGDTMTGALTVPANGFTVGTNDLVATGSKVGIGIALPTTKLDVAGTLKISSAGETCTGGVGGGMIHYLGGNLEFCNGTAWQTLGISGAGPSFAGDVSGTAGANSVDKIKGTPVAYTAFATGNYLKYDGTNWTNAVLSAADLSAGTLNAARLPAFSGDASSVAGTSTLTLATVPVNKGGTGLTTGTAGGVPYYSGTGTTMASTAAGTAGQVLTSNGAAAPTWAAPAAGLSGTGTVGAIPKFSAASAVADSALFDNAGNIGIGSVVPTAKLDVAGTLKVSLGSETCTTAANGGLIRYSGTSLQFCNGTAWQSLSGSGAGVASVILKDSGSNTITLKAPTTVSASYNLQFPAAAPTVDGQVLSSTMAGVASWIDSGTNLNASTAFSSGVLPVNRGGSGVSSLAANGILTANASGTAISSTTCSTGYLLKWNGSGWVCATDIVGLGAVSNTAPLGDGKVWIGDSGGLAQERTLAGDATISNLGAVTLATVPVTKGGTGVTALSANGMITVNGSGNGLQSTTCASGQTLLWNGSAWACGTPGGNIQGAISIMATTGAACASVGQLATNASGDLLVCDEDISILTTSSCSSVGALTMDAGGNLYACIN